MSTITPGAMTRKRPRAPRLGLADLLGLVAMAAVLVVVWMWMRNGGIQTGVSSTEGALSSLGLITGLVSSVLMILMVLALARIPLVERAWGHDQLTHRHRTLGYWSFWLMMAHVVLFAIERAWDTGWTGLYDVFVRNPCYLFATLGTILLVGVVVTSIRWARRRLRYESWHLLHLYSYLGMGLALPHQIFDGVHFHGFWTRVYWWGLYFMALGSILIFRVGVPM